MAFFSKKPQSINVRHVHGLPIPEETICMTCVVANKLCISAGNTRYELSTEQILNATFDMDVNVERYLKSNKLAGAIGAVTFGVTGAVIASAPKEKKKNLVTGYVIIRYLSAENNEEYLLLKDTQPNSLEAAKVADLINRNVSKSAEKTVTL